MRRTVIGMVFIGALALTGCGSDDKTTAKVSDAASSMTTTSSSPSASSPTSTESSADSASSSPAASSSPVSSTMSSSTSASGAAASSGETVKVAKFQKAPAVVGRWKLSKTVDATSTSAVYNDGTGVGANYEVSDSLSESDARARLKTQISNIPGGFCGVGAADYALCFLKTDKNGMVTASATASDPKQNITVTKEFAQALYAVTK